MMINLDAYLIEFFKYNGLTVAALFLILRGLAAVSPWTWDNQLLDIIISAFDIFTVKTKRNGDSNAITGKESTDQP